MSTPVEDILAVQAEEDPQGLTEEAQCEAESAYWAKCNAERRANMTPEELLDEDVEPLELRGSEPDTVLHWFDQLGDFFPACLTEADRKLAQTIAAQLGYSK